VTVAHPTRLPPAPASLGRLGAALDWLAAALGAWPPIAPRQRRDLHVVDGTGLAAGRAEADALADAGVDLLTLEVEADPTAAHVVVCALLDLEPVMAVGTSGGPGWAQQLVAVRDGLRAARSAVGEPEQLAADPVLGRAAGLLAQSALRRTPVILGGSVTVAAAALVAERIAPDARLWWLAGTSPVGAAARTAMLDLTGEPLLDLGLEVPGGAVLAADLVVRAVSLVNPV